MKFFGVPFSLGALACGMIWGIAVVGGISWLAWYENAPGAGGEVPRVWPPDARVKPDPHRPTLVMALHPQCPCSRASLTELEQVMTRCAGLVTALVLVYRPGDFPAGWEKTDLTRRAEAIPGVSVQSDVDGRQGQCFGAETSGQVMLYGADGRLLFTGGITLGRGHEGDNPGLNSVVALLRGEAAQHEQCVFGCPLRGPENRTATVAMNLSCKPQ